MDANELLKAAPELHKIAAIIVGGVPFSEIVKRIVLPSADALGERMKNRVERCFEKAGKMILEAGVPPQTPPDKIVIEILQGASLEENEDLHTMFAALLANAASPDNADGVRPGFISILKQMSPDDAAVLHWIGNYIEDVTNRSFTIEDPDADLHYGINRMAVCLDVLEASLLIRSYRPHGELQSGVGSKDRSVIFPPVPLFTITNLGYQFIIACRPPNPQS